MVNSKDSPYDGWTVEEVQDEFDCTDKEAEKVLERVFYKCNLNEVIWDMILTVGDDMELRRHSDI